MITNEITISVPAFIGPYVLLRYQKERVKLETIEDSIYFPLGEIDQVIAALEEAKEMRMKSRQKNSGIGIYIYPLKSFNLLHGNCLTLEAQSSSTFVLSISGSLKSGSSGGQVELLYRKLPKLIEAFHQMKFEVNQS